jgi:hypothetical protein
MKASVVSAREGGLRLAASNGRRLDSAERQLHLLDVENGIGCGQLDEADVSELKRTYLQAVLVHEGAQFVGATSSSSGLAEAYWGWGTGPRWTHLDGSDGADLCLLSELEHPKTAQRYTHVYLLSGDHIFTEAVRALVEAGVEVVVVSRPSALNYRLSCVASRVVYLPENEPLTGAETAKVA